YVSGGGVVWVQGAIQGTTGNSYPFPFGGQANWDLQGTDRIVDPTSPMVQGVPDPITGNFASHADDSGLPADAHVVVRPIEPSGPPTLYDLRRGTCGPTPTPTATVTATPTPTGTPTCTPAWRNEPPMLAVRAFASGAVANNAFYVLTGFNGSAYETESDYFNGSVWAMGAPIPTGHSQSKAAAVGNNIYVPGGYNSISFGGPINLMQIYNTTANTWSNGMNLPATRSGAAVAAFNGKVYIIAGCTIPFP